MDIIQAIYQARTHGQKIRPVDADVDFYVRYRSDGNFVNQEGTVYNLFHHGDIVTEWEISYHHRIYMDRIFAIMALRRGEYIAHKRTHSHVAYGYDATKLDERIEFLLRAEILDPDHKPLTYLEQLPNHPGDYWFVVHEEDVIKSYKNMKKEVKFGRKANVC